MDETRYSRVLDWLYGRRTDLAKRDLKDCLAEDPEDPDAHALLARAYYIDGENEPALETAETALKLDGAHELAAMTRGLALLSLGRTKEAQILAERLLEVDPNDSEYWGLLAWSHYQLLEWKEAKAAAERGLECDPDSEYCVTALARARIELHETKEAETDLRRALQRDPENPNLLCELGYSAQFRGRGQQAYDHFRETLTILPDNQYAKRGLIEARRLAFAPYRWLHVLAAWLRRLGDAEEGMLMLFIIAPHIAVAGVAWLLGTLLNYAVFLGRHIGPSRRLNFEVSQSMNVRDVLQSHIVVVGTIAAVVVGLTTYRPESIVALTIGMTILISRGLDPGNSLPTWIYYMVGVIALVGVVALLLMTSPGLGRESEQVALMFWFGFLAYAAAVFGPW